MYLINTPAASTFMQRMGTDTGRRAFLGDKAKYNAGAINHIGYAHNAATELVSMIAALAGDPTRSEPEKHDAGRTVATKVANVFRQSQSGFRGVAAELGSEAGQIIRDTFKLDPDRQFVHRLTVEWLREQLKTVEGMAKVQADLRDDKELASVLAATPGRLMNLNDDVRRSMFDRAIERFAPEAHARLEQIGDLTALADKYGKHADEVHLHSYNSTVADQAARRVQI